MEDYTPETGDKEREVLEVARERRKQCVQAESKNRGYAQDDIRFAAGFQWPDEIQTQREGDPNGARPCLTINKTGQYIRQVVNDARQNSPSIKVFPNGGGSDKDTAAVFNGLIRDCEQRTDADTAYDTSIESAARCGEGYWRLISRYIEDQPEPEDKDAFAQEIAFQRIRNFATVHLDPNGICPAGSDSKFGFVDEWIPSKLFKDEYGEAAMAGLDSQGLGEHAPNWTQGDNILVAEYYSLEKGQKRTLVMLKSGSQVILEELAEEPALDDIVASRDVRMLRCIWRKITGNSILEKTVWPCRYIPIFRVIGEEFEVDGELYHQGLIRPSKDSQRMYNYWVSTATEKGALESKAPYIGAEGQFEGHEQQWKTANRVPYAYLEYKQVELEGNLAPPPARNVASFAGMADIQMAQLAAEDMNTTTGIYKPGLGAESQEKSGKALIAQQRQGDTSTFHYIDNLARAQKHCGRVLVAVLPKYLNKEQIVRIVGEDDEDKMITINGTEKDETGDIIKRVNDITVGRYDVRVNIGPSYATRRLESADSMMQFARYMPEQSRAFADLIAKAMDWPGADIIAERIKRTMPPELTREDDDEELLNPEQVQQMINQAMEQLAQQFQGSIEERETAVKEQDSLTKRLAMLEDAAGDKGELREQVAELIAEYLQQATNEGINQP